MGGSTKFGVLLAIVALGAIGGANASAATFTASATGSVIGKPTATLIFTLNGGQVKCTKNSISGVIGSIASPEQHVTELWGGCTAFGFANIHGSAVTLLYTASGAVHIVNTITINVTLGGCHVTIPSQTVSTTSYAVVGATKLQIEPAWSQIAYKSTGGLCGSGGVNGTLMGGKELERAGGGSFTWDK